MSEHCFAPRTPVLYRFLTIMLIIPPQHFLKVTLHGNINSLHYCESHDLCNKHKGRLA